MKFTALLLLAGLGLLAPSFISTKNSAENQPALAGKVTDETRVPRFGATVQVFLEGKTVANVITNFDGEFKIDSLAPGNYSVEINSVGFENRRFIDVLIEKDKTVWLDAILNRGAQLNEADILKGIRSFEKGNHEMNIEFGDRNIGIQKMRPIPQNEPPKPDI